MRMQGEDRLALEHAGAILDAADHRVAVFHRKRERPRHQRRAHPVIFALGHAAGLHQRLGAAADGAVQRADAQLASCGRRQGLLADFRTPRLHVPEAARDIVWPAATQLRLDSGHAARYT